MLSSCRDTIADLLGCYISISRIKKYEVLEEFSRAEVEYKRTIRQSFVNQVLKRMKYYNYNRALEAYMLANECSIRAGEKERNLQSSLCQVKESGKGDWNTYYLVITNRGFYLL